ncbi:MAG: ATP-binding cassette domain-containing protein, partial [Candidatus Methylomirabilia bacterium]
MRGSKALQFAAWAAGIAALIAFPWWSDNYLIHIASLVGVFIVVAVGMNILVGMTGLVSLGHAGLFALGAYTSALLGTRLEVGFWLSAMAGILVAGAVGAVLAFAALRARGIYLAMVTIAFGIIVEQVALDQDEFTGGFMGISSIPTPSVAGFDFTPPFRLYLIAVLAGISLWLARNLRHSRWGRALLAVRENWVAAESLGVSRYRMETMAFTLSAALTGLGGALFAAQNAFIAPAIFTFDLSILMLLFVILGGLGTVWGPAVGTVVLLVLPELISGFESFRLIVYGAVMLGCLYLMPQGIAGFFEARRRPLPAAGPRPHQVADARGLADVLHRRQLSQAAGPLVRIEGISKVFGGLLALEGLDMDIETGSIHSLIGPNGAGKTTLVNVLSGFYRPNAGQIHFADRRVTGWSPHRMAAIGVARTFQATRLFPQLTVLENVMVGLHRHLHEDLGQAL